MLNPEKWKKTRSSAKLYISWQWIGERSEPPSGLNRQFFCIHVFMFVTGNVHTVMLYVLLILRAHSPAHQQCIYSIHLCSILHMHNSYMYIRENPRGTCRSYFSRSVSDVYTPRRMWASHALWMCALQSLDTTEQRVIYTAFSTHYNYTCTMYMPVLYGLVRWVSILFLLLC